MHVLSGSFLHYYKHLRLGDVKIGSLGELWIICFEVILFFNYESEGFSIVQFEVAYPVFVHDSYT